MSRPVPRIAACAAAVAMVVTFGALMMPAAQATPNVGVTGKVLSKVLVDGRMHLNTHGPSDLQLTVLTVAPHGQIGWHSHNGNALVSVVEGIATRYMAMDRRCRPEHFGPGQGWVEVPHHVHTVHNETDQPLILNVVLITPTGQAPGVDEPDPGNCRF
ncbi:quercetin dioxygenase-like cupin family protein [Kibdelosporangium banguiense]|uniref:Quercetin dioxygenase-like cupin family protein n=1 Tax=Kibdelosporangium banguiense TaxID=1365924 RepID=A0ABS4TYZ6_9PSEU|nr:cupin domain-containing protein [Kibdelosporangium banguiense]MBP2329638.1 quercetin dioxygenase-like cupin family protein [Kibdelosporangium banguiense]